MDKLQSLMPEYVILEKLKDEIEVGPATYEQVEPFMKKHYLHDLPKARVTKIYGVFRKPNREMIGGIVYGPPFHTVSKMLSKLAQPNEILELTRLFIDDVGLRNAESYVIGQSLKLLQQDMPDLKIVITFADSKAGHVGGIYQATNAVYIGQSGGKHRYLYFFGKDADKMKSMVQSQPYPKKELPTQLDKAIQEAESHFPGMVRRNFWNFGTVKTNHLTGKREWVMEMFNKGKHYSREHAIQNAIVMMFVWGLNSFGAKYLTSSDAEKLLSTKTVRATITREGIVSPRHIQLAVFIPRKLFRASALDAIEDNHLRASRDMANAVEKDLVQHGVNMSLDLTILQDIKPEYVGIFWNAKRTDYEEPFDPFEADPSKNQ